MVRSVVIIMVLLTGGCERSNPVAPPPLQQRVSGIIGFEGPPPKLYPITNGHAVPDVGWTHQPDQYFALDANGGLANVIVAVENPPDRQKRSGDVRVEMRDGLYQPSVVAMQLGQRLVLENRDRYLHNPHSMSRQNQSAKEIEFAQQNGSIPFGETPKSVEIFKIKCDVHPWMVMTVGVFDHQWFAVTAKDGSFSLPPLPDGRYRLKLFHPRLTEQAAEFEVNGGVGTISASMSAALQG